MNIKYSALDGSSGFSQGIVLDHYDLWEIHTRIDVFMASAFKAVMDSLIIHSDHLDDAPSYRSHENRAEYTSYYKYHTFTVSLSHVMNSSEKTPLTIYFNIKANSDEETMETRREMNAIRNRTFSRLLDIIISHGDDYDDIHYENEEDLNNEWAYDRYG